MNGIQIDFTQVSDAVGIGKLVDLNLPITDKQLVKYIKELEKAVNFLDTTSLPELCAEKLKFFKLRLASMRAERSRRVEELQSGCPI